MDWAWRTKKWPCRSTTLTPYDLFMWGWAKFEVYHSKPGVRDKMEEIFENFSTVSPEFLRKALSVFLPGCRYVQNVGAYI